MSRFGVFCTFALSLSFLTSCSDIIEQEVHSAKTLASMATRASSLGDYYYYYNGEKVYLNSLKHTFYTSSTDSMLLNLGTTTSNNGEMYSRKKGHSNGVSWQIITTTDEEQLNALNAAKKKSATASADSNSDSLFVAPVFGVDGNELPTSEYFYVKIRPSKYDALQKIAQQYGASIIEQVAYLPNWYVLKSNTSKTGLELSNLFFETGEFENVDPAFMFNFMPTGCTSEPMESSQWGLSAIDMCNAWNITKGSSNVTVAVIDQGIDQSHLEFAQNFSSLSYDLHNQSSPSVVRGDHGTHVGGIIGANHNGYQIVGVAPNVTMMSISHSLYLSQTFLKN